MTQNALQSIEKVGLLAAMALLSMSCSLPARQENQPEHLRQVNRSPLVHKLTQIDFGGKASYAACMEPACPAVTRKTLARIEPAAAPTAKNPGTPQTSDAPPTDMPALRLATTLQTPPGTHRAIVRFASGSAMLAPSEKAQLDRAMAGASETGEIVITGYTDSTGSLRANQRLAQARAQAVHDHLRAHLPAHQTTLALAAQGACCFLAANDTPQGRKQNRRVEVVLRASREAPP